MADRVYVLEQGKVAPQGLPENLMKDPIKLSETPGKITSLAPSLGQHTKEILQELGYSGEAIEGFRREKVI